MEQTATVLTGSPLESTRQEGCCCQVMEIYGIRIIEPDNPVTVYHRAVLPGARYVRRDVNRSPAGIRGVHEDIPLAVPCVQPDDAVPGYGGIDLVLSEYLV